MLSVVRWSSPSCHLAGIENHSLCHLELLRSRPRRCHCYHQAKKQPAAAQISRSRCFRSARFAPVVRCGVPPPAPLAAGEAEVVFSETFRLRRSQTVEGKVWVRLDAAEESETKGRVVIGCDLDGKWILHWGVTYYVDAESMEICSEWDQPPLEMRPPGSVPVKDYAIETPMKMSSCNSEGQMVHEVQIDFDRNASIAAINFVLKDEETGAWFQHKGRDFRISLRESIECEDSLAAKQSVDIWPGEGSRSPSRCMAGIYEEYSIFKEELVQSSITVTVKKSSERGKNLVQFDTDIPGQVILHWGLCNGNATKWELPSPPLPPATRNFRQKALQTLLEPKADGLGSHGLFSVDTAFSGLLFVIKLNEYTWLRSTDEGSDFYIPLNSMSNSSTPVSLKQSGSIKETPQDIENNPEKDLTYPEKIYSLSNDQKTESILPGQSTTEDRVSEEAADTNEIISGIRSLLAGISSQNDEATKSKEVQENILQEIEKLAAEAYRIFRHPTVSSVEEPASETDSSDTKATICSGTGSGYEILCQGFNWESHKSERWYLELGPKAKELSSLGFTIVWLPPPTESVSPEGYMPKDLYNLNSRYGNVEQLKDLVKKFHEVGIKVLGDVVLNHRCAHFQNQNGIWNIFGGRLNWDDRAVVADDPHFQGRGNKSSGDNFHAAPNIDHSQDFVRKDIKEWLCWLRKEVGYDGWRLDFVRGFWGGYVKDYLEASSPYFAVGEHWDSLSYTYGEMDYNQDAHRQRIIDWINATNGTAGAFDVTTKGILHSALERREYWRLSDEKGKPPGVLGWWPSRAVTFIENHDTGSTQGHWRFPSGREMQGYAYILTHPGTPAVFFDHIFSQYREEMSKLISIRRRQKIHCRSTVKITKAEKDVYAAVVDGKIAMKIGPGHYEPPSDSNKWALAAQGQDYMVWEAL